MLAKRAKSKQGLTLVEVLVAMAVLGVALATLGYLVTALRNSARSDEATAAANFARSYLDALRTEWQVPSEYRAYDSGTKQTFVELELPPPPKLFSEYQLEIQFFNTTLDKKGTDVVVNYKLATNSKTVQKKINTLPAKVEDDVLRKVTLTLLDKQGKKQTPFVTQIVSPTVTKAGK